MQDTYKRRYVSLKRKCDSLELSNERVLNRLCHVKKYIHKLSRERRGLAKKLTELGDEFKKSDLTVPLEDELPGAMIGASESPSSSGPAIGENLGGFSPFIQGDPSIKSEEMVSSQEPPQPIVVPVKSGRKKRSRDGNKPEREKDPNAPKKPANAFLMYCQQERQKVQDGEGNGIYSADLSHQDLTRQLAKQWKFLSEDEKKRYYLMYEKEKDRYDKAVKKYAKGVGNDKKKMSRGTGNDVESEPIDVKMGQEKDWRRKDFREEKVTLKASHSNEDQTIDVEKDEFEFSDPPVIAEEPKICLEKIDKSKLFDKARLFGLPSLDTQDQERSGSKAEAGSKQIKDLFAKTEMRPLSRSPRPDFKGPAILEIATGRKSASPTILSHAAPKMLPEAPIRPTMDLSIKELVGARPSTFEVRNPAMMELKSKGEERTVLASALRNKPMFDMKMRSTIHVDYTKHKPVGDVTRPSGDASDPWSMVSSEAKTKLTTEMRSRVSADQDKPKTLIDANPKAFIDSKPTPPSELRNKPAISETTKSVSPLEIKARGSPETMRRLSLDNKRAVVELKKIPVDPSDDPYHFDD